MGVLNSIPALRHANFRLYFVGQAVSVIGSWVQTVAISWTLYQLTNSASLLGIAAFLTQGPQLVLTPLAGVWIDRHDLRRMLSAVQIINGVLAAALALLAGLGWLLPVHLLVASALLGVLNSFDTPLRQSLLIHLVEDRRDLGSAIGLNASIFTMGRFIGPPVAGAMLAAFSPAACFLANALSYAGLIVALAVMHIKPTAKPPRAGVSVWQSLLEGMRHAHAVPAIRVPLGLLAAVNISAASALVLAPVFAAQVFGGHTEVLGWLLGVAGAGAVSGTVLMARAGSLPAIARLLARAPWLSLAGLVALILVPRWELALPAMFLVGAGIATTNVTTNALLQSSAAETLRARVISLFAATRFGMDALGGLIAGLLASLIGPIGAIALEAVVLAGLMVWLVPKVRRVGAGLKG